MLSLLPRRVGPPAAWPHSRFISLESDIREEVAAEMAEQLVEIEQSYDTALYGHAEAQQSRYERKVNCLTNRWERETMVHEGGDRVGTTVWAPLAHVMLFRRATQHQTPPCPQAYSARRGG